MIHHLKPKWQAWGRFLSLFLLCATVVIACASDNDAVENEIETLNGERSRITLGTTQKPSHLDPADSYQIAGLGILYNLSDCLFAYELDSTELKPQLATALPEVSDDGLTYTIPLREDVVFHDQTPFNAEAMAFSLRRFMENEGQPSFLLADIVNSVEATGDYELTIELDSPFSAFPALLAFTGTAAVSPNAYEIGKDQFNEETFVGTGPYQLTEWEEDSLELTAFEQYWGETPENAGVNIQFYANEATELFEAFQDGEVDVAYQSLDVDQIRYLVEEATEGKWQAVSSPGMAVVYMALNVTKEPLDDPQVRRAIASMIDRNLFTETTLEGQAEPIYSLIPTSVEVYEPAFQNQYGDGNIEQAKALLTEAGYSEDDPVTVEIWYPGASHNRHLVASRLQEYAEEHLEGLLQFEPQGNDDGTFFSSVREGLYPISLVDWHPDFIDPDNYIHPFVSCGEGSEETGCEEGGAASQGSFYYNERLNELVTLQRQEQDPETRQEQFAEIQEIIATDVPYIPLWQVKNHVFAQNEITGVKLSPSQGFPYWTMAK
ncbi:peptide ABC transporter substrate-binding protein [Euhalothece natronophila Z-M001]|uniref:Peptide ABC transporter substrate-binding protein n=1 Tax=Euhalothece natronophila Z-M001 TaxID=522448 RepID=A0A5B8NJ39_9CHRO|nr:ABC transporter substrate-binding protein [Euhalothece natronophila]QDZ39283.1 peptide ABC transporter substrate-binding protein [Euhalothece natronophila Z-M001]